MKQPHGLFGSYTEAEERAGGRICEERRGGGGRNDSEKDRIPVMKEK